MLEGDPITANDAVSRAGLVGNAHGFQGCADPAGHVVLPSTSPLMCNAFDPLIIFQQYR